MDQQLKSLVEKAIAGDKEAFAKLLDHYMKDILYFATLRLHRQEAEDVAQEVAIVMFKQIHKLRDPERFVFWVSTIVHNVSINYMKKFYKTTTVDIDSFDDSLLSTDSLNAQDMEFLPDQYVEKAELRDIVMEEIHKLPENQRLCLTYYCLQELKRSEIAEITGLSPRQVSTGLNYGKKTLKLRLEERLGKNFTFSVAPVGTISVLAQIMRADQAMFISPELSAEVTKTCLSQINHIKTPIKKARLTSAKAVAGITTSAVAVTAVVIMALNSVRMEQPISVPPATTAMVATMVEASTTAEQPIRTLADMVGEDAADILESFVTGSVNEKDWQEFLKRIGAEENETAADTDCSYTIYSLEKQDKRLLLVEQKQLEGGGICVLYDFDEKANEPMKMAQFILQFDLG